MKMPTTLYTAVKALIQNGDGKVLVLKQSDTTITGGNLSLQQSEIDACFSVLSDYVNALPAGESLVVATLTQKVVSKVGILNLDSDVRVSFEIFNRDVGGASGGNGGSGMVTSVINPAKTFHFILGEVTSISIGV